MKILQILHTNIMNIHNMHAIIDDDDDVVLGAKNLTMTNINI